MDMCFIHRCDGYMVAMQQSMMLMGVSGHAWEGAFYWWVFAYGMGVIRGVSRSLPSPPSSLPGVIHSPVAFYMLYWYQSACLMDIVYVASYSGIMNIHGYPITPMDMMESQGNRYLLMVASHPSHGQTPTNRLYLSMDISLQPWIETIFTEKSAKCAINTNPILTSVNII